MARPKSGNEKINLLMPPQVVKGFRVLAKRRGSSYSELIRQACREFLVRELQSERTSDEHA